MIVILFAFNCNRLITKSFRWNSEAYIATVHTSICNATTKFGLVDRLSC
jgi:hypothetical protein